MATDISYNGAVIGTLEPGKTATLACAGKKAVGNIAVAFDGAGTITYHGSATEVEAGKTATLQCAGKKMTSDVYITAQKAVAPDTLEGIWQLNRELSYLPLSQKLNKGINMYASITQFVPGDTYKYFQFQSHNNPNCDTTKLFLRLGGGGSSGWSSSDFYNKSSSTVGWSNYNRTSLIQIASTYEEAVELTNAGYDSDVGEQYVSAVFEWLKTNAVKRTEKLIRFGISSSNYIAEEGMTWREWIESEYNWDSFVLNGSNVETSAGYEVYTTADEVIQANTWYEVYSPPSGSGGSN